MLQNVASDFCYCKICLRLPPHYEDLPDDCEEFSICSFHAAQYSTIIHTNKGVNIFNNVLRIQYGEDVTHKIHLLIFEESDLKIYLKLDRIFLYFPTCVLKPKYINNCEELETILLTPDDGK